MACVSCVRTDEEHEHAAERQEEQPIVAHHLCDQLVGQRRLEHEVDADERRVLGELGCVGHQGVLPRGHDRRPVRVGVRRGLRGAHVDQGLERRRTLERAVHTGELHSAHDQVAQERLAEGGLLRRPAHDEVRVGVGLDGGEVEAPVVEHRVVAAHVRLGRVGVHAQVGEGVGAVLPLDRHVEQHRMQPVHLLQVRARFVGRYRLLVRR